MPEPCGNPGAYCHCGQNCPQGFDLRDYPEDFPTPTMFDLDRVRDAQEREYPDTWQEMVNDCDPVLLGFTLVFILALACFGVITLLGLLA